MDEFKIGQLTKELVAVKLKRMEDPCAAAAEMVKKTLAVALKGLASEDPVCVKAVAEASEGGMTGLLLAEHSQGRGAVLILEAVAELANELGLDPTALMQSALQGIARVNRFLTPNQGEEVRHAIGAHFMGASEVYSGFVMEIEEARLKASGSGG